MRLETATMAARAAINTGARRLKSCILKQKQRTAAEFPEFFDVDGDASR
jgi:hypothetical protein